MKIIKLVSFVEKVILAKNDSAGESEQSKNLDNRRIGRVEKGGH